MHYTEIIVIFLLIVFLSIYLGIYIYKKIKHLPRGECASCKTKKSRLLKEYRKKYKKFD